MKNTKMRSGFTMIELIFVIVVLGILAAVAMPKFVSVQDDARVSSEKATVGAIKSAVGMLHGKALIKSDDFYTKFTDGTGTQKTLKISVSDTLFPKSLSVTDTETAATASEPAHYPIETTAAVDGTDWTMAVVLDLEGRKDWSTAAPTDVDGTKGYYTVTFEGPATKAKGVKDDSTIDEFEVDSAGNWVYDSTIGRIAYDKDDTTATID
jgi:prepilin-type N-terminal cleavage/methylation domain-containing protein